MKKRMLLFLFASAVSAVLCADMIGGSSSSSGGGVPPRLYITPFAGNAAFAVATSSNILTCPLYAPVPVTVTGYTYDSPVTGSANVLFGILDKNGNVLMSTGPVALASGLQALAQNPVSIPAGEYNLAVQISNTSGQIQGTSETNSGTTGCSQTAEAALGIVSLTLPGAVATSATPAVSVLISGGRQTYK